MKQLRGVCVHEAVWLFGCFVVAVSYFLISLMMKITRQDPITPPMMLPMIPWMTKLPASQLKSAPPTSPIRTLIYQGNELFMMIPASQPQIPAIISEIISP